MSFRLVQTHSPGGDECAPYDVILDKRYIVKEFINEVLAREPNEWGCFSIGGYFGQRVNYSRGKLKESLPEEISSLEIATVSASGGWSRMDYIIKPSTIDG